MCANLVKSQSLIVGAISTNWKLELQTRSTNL
jgi:hypothetical protein